MADLFSPVRIGTFELPNRLVMAPMTRNRAGVGNVPSALNATYYAQRAGAALIVTEGTQISPQGLGYPQHTRHPFRRSDRGMETDHRCRS